MKLSIGLPILLLGLIVSAVASAETPELTVAPAFSSRAPMLGSPFPLFTAASSNAAGNRGATPFVTLNNVANMWILRQSITQGAAGKQSWHAKYIYNADRTLANIFQPTRDTFAASLGTIPGIQITTIGNSLQKFSGAKPRFSFRSAKGATPSIIVVLNESNQTITIDATSETFPDIVPGVFENNVQLGASNFLVEQAADVNGRFTATAGYRSAAFVVSHASIVFGKLGNDAAMFSLLLGDPAFAYPGASGAKTVHFRVTNVLNQIVIDKDLTSSIVAKAGVLKSAGGTFSYNSNVGIMTFKMITASLASLLVTSEEQVRVDVTIGDQTYTTRVTLFSAGCRKIVAYNTLMPRKFCNFVPGRLADTTAPTVLSTVPANLASSVAINSKISAIFSEAMDPLTLNMTTFTLMQGVNSVGGMVTYAQAGNIATFMPTSDLVPNAPYTATITTGAKDLAGNALAANFVWTFTTGPTANTTPPTVVSTNPANNETGVAINHAANATFDEAMDPATLNTTNFTLSGPGPNPVTGNVAYDAVNFIATFTPGSNLAPNTQYTATLTTGVKDLAGNALAVNYVWTFMTGAQQALQPVSLGAAAPFGTSGGGAGMTNQGIFTVVNGDISTTGASTTVTGFHDSVGDIYTETPLNKGQVNGRIYTAPPTPGGAGVGGNASTLAIATQAASDANAAYIKLSPASMPGGTDPGAGQLGGLTLPSGIYQAAGGTFQITGSDLTLDAHGDSNAVWVFQMAASLTVGGPAQPRSVILINGAQAKNVFWQVGSAATINAAGGGTMVGTILASSGITFSTAGNVTLTTLNGRAIGLHASSTLVNTIINVPAP